MHSHNFTQRYTDIIVSSGIRKITIATTVYNHERMHSSYPYKYYYDSNTYNTHKNTINMIKLNKININLSVRCCSSTVLRPITAPVLFKFVTIHSIKYHHY